MSLSLSLSARGGQRRVADRRGGETHKIMTVPHSDVFWWRHDVTQFFAHSSPDNSPLSPPSKEDWQILRDHLVRVSDETGRRAAHSNLAEEGRLAGLLHDIGKYAARFQRRLEGRRESVNHWSIGAYVAARLKARLAAFAIAGHHVGLGSPAAMDGLAREAREHLSSWNIAESPMAIQDLAERDGVHLPVIPPDKWTPLRAERSRVALAVRMLFSALCDADFVDTEYHFDRYTQARQRRGAPNLDPTRALDILLEHLRRKARALEPESDGIAALRNTVLHDCLRAAETSDRLFTLTAPTGAGKTLASLAFALRNAAVRELRRVIVVVPYLSIIEQTAAVFRDIFDPIFGPQYVLEHHSLADRSLVHRDNPSEAQDSLDDCERQRRLLAENWDAPLVVTTSVQFFESLFACTPRACRKVHNIAGSVVYLDEVQTLPTRLAAATLEMLNALIADHGVTVVFGTATQPAFRVLSSIIPGGWTPREIILDSPALFEQLRRIEVRWPATTDSRMDWPEVAAELVRHPQALCVVNLKRHAVALVRALLDLVPSDERSSVLHLSTALCPAHRRVILDHVQDRLRTGEKVRLVATQCIEAGVDVDFPVVWRALGPLDSLAQAFGRCNREGRMPRRLAEAQIFVPTDAEIPMEDYAQATKLVTAHFWGADLCSPSAFSAYYEHLYGVQGLVGGGGSIQQQLREALEHLDFPAMAEGYRLIPDNTISAIVQYASEGRTLWSALKRRDLERDQVRALIRRAQPYSVNLYRQQAGRPEIASNLSPVAGDIRGDAWVWMGNYDSKIFGVLDEGALIV